MLNNYPVLLIFASLFVLSIQVDVLAEEAPESETSFDFVSLDNSGDDVNKTFTNLYKQIMVRNIVGNEKDINETAAANDTRKQLNCKEIIYENTDTKFEPAVEIINGTTLTKLLISMPNITSRDVEGLCVLVLFHARQCPFSAATAPHFNALQRAFPNIKMVALDALKHHGINAQYGIVGVPTLKLFHNGKPCGRYNGTEYHISAFARFLTGATGQQPVSIVVNFKDFVGPVSCEILVETDYFLILSWAFIIVCAVYYFVQSKWWKMIVEMVQNNWRESEAQHEHND